MKKAILLTLILLSGCSIIGGIQAPSNFSVHYNCNSQINVTHNVSVKIGCDGVDTVFVDKDTIVLIPNH